MTYPLKSPYNVVTTAYGKRGSYWSCNEDSSGNGVHTGCDLAAPSGTPIYAPIAGQIRHRSYGSAFGSHQFAISPDSDQPFAEDEVFFAHTQTRLKDGVYVDVGDFIAEVGAEGNVSGPHLHMEYHKGTKNSWNCNVHDNPQPILDYEPTTTAPPEEGETKTFPLGIQYHYSGKPSGDLTFSGSYKKLDVSAWAPKKDGLTFGMLYANVDGEGEFRTRLVRDPDDATSYQTHYAKSGDNYLLTHVWFESGEGGRKLWYEFCSMDGTTHTVTTRYAKFVTIPWEVTVVLEQAAAAYSAVSRPVGRFVNWLLEK